MKDNKNTFKVPYNSKSWNELNLTARAVYTVIACKSDFITRKSEIRRDTICNILGIKDIDSISKYTNQLTELGLLEKTYLDKFHLKAVYTVVDIPNNFVLVKRDVVKSGLTDKQLGLFVSLCSVGANNDVVDLPYLYKECNINKRTYYKFLKELQTANLVEVDKGVVTICSFLPEKSLNATAQKLLNEAKEAVKDLTTEEISWPVKMVLEKEKTGWKGISSPSNWVIKMFTGVVNKPVKKEPIIISF